jgi:hypothetical protein
MYNCFLSYYSCDLSKRNVNSKFLTSYVVGRTWLLNVTGRQLKLCSLLIINVKIIYNLVKYIY